MAHAKRCGGRATADFCFRNYDKLTALVERSWKVDNVEDAVSYHSKSRMDILQSALLVLARASGQSTQTRS